MGEMNITYFSSSLSQTPFLAWRWNMLFLHCVFMFPKCVLRQFGRGQRPQQAYHFTKSLLVRWRLGERAGLWSEACQASTPKPRGARAHPSPDTIRAHKVLEAERLAGLGRPSQAIHRLQSPGLAHDTPQVKQKLLAKFPPVPPHTPAADTLHMPPHPSSPYPWWRKLSGPFPLVRDQDLMDYAPICLRH